MAARRVRLGASAANGSAHSAYQGMSQLTVATASSAAQPAGASERVRRAAYAQPSSPAISSTVAARRTAASAPPCPAA